MGQSDELITSTQAGVLLGKSGRTVVRMAVKDKIPIAGKIHGPNGAYLFRRRDVEALVALLAGEAL